MTDSLEGKEGAMLVSVYVPTKNRLSTLTLAVESVLSQDHTEVELLIVDDASTDGTWPYLQALAEKHAFVKVFRNEASKGACAARNMAIKASSGAFITGLDDDDEFTPDHLSSLLSYWLLLTMSGQTVPSCLYPQCFFRKGENLYESRKWSAVTSDDLIDVNRVGNQIFAPREHFFGAGLFDEGMPAWQDLEFFYRVVKQYGTARLLDKPTYVFDVTPRPDRISLGQKAKILSAAHKMIAAHANGNGRVAQRLLLQVYDDYYGFKVELADLIAFMKLGRWRDGYAQLGSKYVLGKLSGLKRKFGASSS
jgi:glycosyltransferase involved in cell wall biosynthesis